MKITIIIGNRPQFVKAAALFRAIQRSDETSLNVQLVHTGQHYDKNMSQVFFEELDLPAPDYFLGVGGCSQGAMTGRMLEQIEKLLEDEWPDWVLVFGDTNTTLAGALAAVKMHIPVAHVEAGLRSFNRAMPEEINRILVDHCADILFCPGEAASQQLRAEGISAEKIHPVGDVMLDAFLYYQKRAAVKSAILKRLQLEKGKYALVTIHRAGNTDDPSRLGEIIMGLESLTSKTPVVFPVHPRTRQALEGLKMDFQSKVHLIEPVGFLDMIQLESHARVILTDSGGVQKEAYFCNVPCLTLRDETEWFELCDHGFNQLVPADRKAIIAAYETLQETSIDWSYQLYGAGHSSEKILRLLVG